MKLKYEIKLMLRPTPTHTRDLRMCGTHNGYLALPEGHPWFGMDYNKIPADVHGGLTYGQMEHTVVGEYNLPSEWVIGFDTCHWGDKPEVQDINFVWAELLRLHDQAQKATADCDTKFYHYSQNNSGGSFIVNERVGNDVVIEARDVDHANTIAESIGIYFDGAGDCPCCGNRWSEANESDGELFPHCYGEKLETLEVSWCRREVYVYYLGSDKPKIIKLS